MTAYEKAVIKAFLNEAFGQMSAEVDGQTIIPGYKDTDSSYPGRMTSNGYGCEFTVMINGGERVSRYTLDTVKFYVLKHYLKMKQKLPNAKNFFVEVYISKSFYMNKYYGISFHTEYPELLNGQTVYLI